MDSHNYTVGDLLVSGSCQVGKIPILDDPPDPRYGVKMSGLPITRKYDKLLSFLGKDTHSTRIWGSKTIKPIKTDLLFTMVDGVKTTTGDAIFIFDHEFQLMWNQQFIVERSNGIRLDKNHTLETDVIRVCKTCHCHLQRTGQSEVRRCDPRSACAPPHLESASGLDPDSCKNCVPDEICCCCRVPLRACDLGPIPDNESYNIYQKYIACQSCRDDDYMQEKWRNSIPVYDAGTSFHEEKYLSDEAIVREKELLGGVSPIPPENITPFMFTFMIENLVDPTSKYYWPYGMDVYDYLVSQNQRIFDNPMSETPDDSWRSIEVTEEIIKDYWKRMIELQAKYDFKSLQEPGSLPSTIEKDGVSYRLFPDIHPVWCDDPICQAINHQQDDMDGGGYSALILTGIPIFTTRKGDLMSDSGRGLGYGHEYCLACIMK